MSIPVEFDAVTIERFWQKVDQRGPNECWEWKASKDRKGYGKFGRWRDGRGFTAGAHRVSYEIAYGDIPTGLFVLHHCDNPCCVNPKHLWLGTARDNIHDMISKGRQRPYKLHQQPGEKNSNSRFTDVEIRMIRAEYVTGLSQRRLAAMHHTSQSQIHRIVLRKTWRHV